MVDYTKASGAVVDAQGRPQFADRNDALGVQGTYLDAEDRNQDRNTLVSAVLASGQVPDGANDDQLTIAIQAEGIPLWSQSVATAIKGYPLGAVVRDASPKYWLSAVPNNMTVPGADGATWMNFFAGVMTQQQADLRYLMLSGGNVTGAMDWGSKTAAAPLTHRYWSAGAPAEGDATPDATLTIAGGTPGTANKGTMALSTGVFDLSATGQVLVPSIASFDGKDALNALTADGRYVRSVPAAGQTRITDLVKNSDGRAIFGSGANNTVLANLADTSVCGTIPGGYYKKTPLNDGTGRHLLEQRFVLMANDSTVVSFPLAYSDDSVVVDLTGTHVGGAGLGTTSRIVNVQEGSPSATGFILDVRYVTENGNGGDTTSHPVYISACGVV